ncbi:hypothetical protein JD77_04716 [Micromonospora olivasterospora]|uniref:Uncharacterized protein n=1 Tax=Micromonospora olivasterospora TaxID=1880 RepID=A0A562IFN3_MICOL|nr:hypothetical protein JD77_04716 [Micromonospora olivasterospora]
MVTADTRYLPPERAERLLRAVEALLVEAAFRDVPWPWSPAPSATTPAEAPAPDRSRVARP